MNAQEQLRTLFIQNFPTLNFTDFPAINAEESASDWMMTWMSDFEISDSILAGCEFNNFSWLLEEKFKNLTVIKAVNYDISIILEKIFNYFEQHENLENLEENLEPNQIDAAAELDYDRLFEEDDEIDFETQYAIALDNITHHLLCHQLNLIVIDHGENVLFIPTQHTTEKLETLAEHLRSIYPESHVSLYLSDQKESYTFEYLLENLAS